ncbi:MAG TPA: GNAT family N-acetyltransferase [Gaiellaceae bacterium]|nr:GNAT family N-acetyltransferase [Gaiellaceae bacterium]
MTPSPLELAEDFTLYLPPRRGFVREVTPGYVLTSGTSGATVARIRLGGDEVARTRLAIRERLRGEDVERCTWWCGSRATPEELPQQLRALGLEPDEEAPVLKALVLDREPAGEPTAEVRRVETFADFRIAMAIDLESTDTPAPVRARREARMQELWEASLEQEAVYYLGYCDGEPVAHARVFFLDGAALLLGASTRPAFRGRGVYFALVHARWRDAVARGTPRLVVQAGPMSLPILERIGFRTLEEIQLLVDRL